MGPDPTIEFATVEAEILEFLRSVPGTLSRSPEIQASLKRMSSFGGRRYALQGFGDAAIEFRARGEGVLTTHLYTRVTDGHRLPPGVFLGLGFGLSARVTDTLRRQLREFFATARFGYRGTTSGREVIPSFRLEERTPGDLGWFQLPYFQSFEEEVAAGRVEASYPLRSCPLAEGQSLRELSRVAVLMANRLSDGDLPMLVRAS